GRWFSEDPIGFAAGDPNLYRYVHNQPTAFGDPSGLQAQQNPPWWQTGLAWVKKAADVLILGGFGIWPKGGKVAQWLGHPARVGRFAGGSTRLTTWTMLLGSPRLFRQVDIAGVRQLTLFGMRQTTNLNRFRARRLPVVGLGISVAAESIEVGLHVYDAIANGR